MLVYDVNLREFWEIDGYTDFKKKIENETKNQAHSCHFPTPNKKKMNARPNTTNTDICARRLELDLMKAELCERENEFDMKSKEFDRLTSKPRDLHAFWCRREDARANEFNARRQILAAQTKEVQARRQVLAAQEELFSAKLNGLHDAATTCYKYPLVIGSICEEVIDAQKQFLRFVNQQELTNDN